MKKLGTALKKGALMAAPILGVCGMVMFAKDVNFAGIVMTVGAVIFGLTVIPAIKMIAAPKE